ncbi:transglycosylase SLT domain-containing protein [Synechococcus sp. WH 8016]|uniref:lytic transglycosylase domain-containing protein n=1 Tax=Synechococcus sp. WH 8016 TaxID=166318 RepID=UPI00022D8C24|nr:transglycosylase SLT domain-containing protein [Synechococcus sp. WH 8016]EHA62234.1 Lytic transglycosylase catalytic [Synechococcus sp. WH 8016]
MPSVSGRVLTVQHSRGLLLLAGTPLLTVAIVLGGQTVLRRLHTPLTPSLSSADLWTRYRWSLNPSERREAALLLAARSPDSAERSQRLLANQGWGNDPLAAVTLKQQALIAAKFGRTAETQQRWQDLLQRFPQSAASADARYHLGQANPALHTELFQQHPGHPAALAAAAETNKDSPKQTIAALHLARWGARWPGAASQIREACNRISGAGLKQTDRLTLAQGLASLGDSRAAEACLQGTPTTPASALAIGRVLLRGNAEQQARGKQQLLELAINHPDDPEALEAAALLSEPLRPDPALLDALPKALQQRSADVAAARVRLADATNGDASNGDLANAMAVLRRWPTSPAAWQLQWDLAREALLKDQWERAEALLNAIPSADLPEPLAARQQFWLGLTLSKQNQPAQAKQIWKRLVKTHPRSYYTWRAEVRLGRGDLPDLDQASTARSADLSDAFQAHWEPLKSGDPFVDRLWRLGQTQEAWETWRNQQPPSDQPSNPSQKLVEGRLRVAVGDAWTGLSRLWRASLRLVNQTCEERQLLHRSQHPRLLSEVFDTASQQEAVRSELLMAIAKQESRFSPSVSSPVGAIGLLQLMPATAEELAGDSLSQEQLREPTRNAKLGARYLRQLLGQWQGNIVLAVASYNAGPGAASRWVTPDLKQDPELWVERIPYPETRLYTKKVLGNLWAYLGSGSDHCDS